MEELTRHHQSNNGEAKPKTEESKHGPYEDLKGRAIRKPLELRQHPNKTRQRYPDRSKKKGEKSRVSYKSSLKKLNTRRIKIHDHEEHESKHRPS